MVKKEIVGKTKKRAEIDRIQISALFKIVDDERSYKAPPVVNVVLQMDTDTEWTLGREAIQAALASVQEKLDAEYNI